MNEIRRIDYMSGPLLEQDLAPSPLLQFEQWLQQANAAGIEEPNAMIVATVDADGQPHVRTMLCKEITGEGFVFFTNYDSDKGRQIDQNPRVALCFHWQPLHRQVRITGVAEPLSDTASDEYFGSRPRDAQLGAWSSAQSQVIDDRGELRVRWEDALQRFPGDVPRPANWGGYLVRPSSVEFWQGQPSRLHDRLRFGTSGTGRLDDEHAWTVQRLAP
ncbi:MAG: pyridoxamine 5'-phosphate oxidase [Actinobacteria bacterium]|nr:pyridoxamine 5'-phosphate oxidase [Actinomycetota bacterium]MCB8996327.1 pyridoxamine 5'-phosphate oxidase [Actinomycetota bacterium]MCB9414847.1 pyridoxamine 5'-phosphate oxidase [Actinomycetota bacterium]